MVSSTECPAVVSVALRFLFLRSAAFHMLQPAGAPWEDLVHPSMCRFEVSEVRLIVNGKTLDLECEVSIAELLKRKGLDPALVAVEHNANLTRREDWARIILRDNDRLEIVRIIGGG